MTDIAANETRGGRLRLLPIGLGLGVFALMLALPAPESLQPNAWRMAAIAVLMALWWITDAIPVYATALLPLALFPLIGISSMTQAAAPYANPVIFLILGGFLLALAIQRWDLHKRIALALMAAMGTGARQLVGGFMIATALLSMWVSNTVTAMVMLPMAISVFALLESEGGKHAMPKGLDTALLLGVAYASCIGGMGTPVGTATNAFVLAYFDSTYGQTISFAQWTLFGVPVAAVLLAAAWVVLTRVSFKLPNTEIQGAAVALAAARTAQGPMSRGEKVVTCVFATAAGLWMFLPLINKAVPGLALTDTGVAMLVAVALFAIPVDIKKGVFALDWEWASRAPWGVLLLVGGGLALADGATDTGLAAWVGAALGDLGSVPPWVMLFMVMAVVVFLTEITSNTAVTAALLPVMAGLAVGVGENPMYLCIPTALAASCAFMLPVATPPNAVVFSSGRITILEMARAGIYLNLACIVILTVLTTVGLTLVFDITPGVVPDWAR